LPVSAAIEAVNRALFPDLTQSDSFITLFHASLAPASGELTYVDAGHGLVLLLRGDGTMVPLRQRSLPLGVDAYAPYPAGTVLLAPGDTLVVYSDGLPDARPDLRLDAEGVASEIASLDGVQAKVERLVALATTSVARPDDLTLVLVRRLPASS
jgi:phosphoserine phosphatase RsbU/P